MAKKNTDKAAIEVDAKEKGRPRHSSKEKPRLRARFQQEIAPALMKELALNNAMAVPRLEKFVGKESLHVLAASGGKYLFTNR